MHRDVSSSSSALDINDDKVVIVVYLVCRSYYYTALTSKARPELGIERGID